MRLNRDDIMILLSAVSIFSRSRREQKRDVLTATAEALAAYDALRGLGDRIEQAGARAEGMTLTLDDVDNLSIVIRALRRGATALKR